MRTRERWNHNIQYHPVILRALAEPCERVLDVGCGEGVLTHQLSRIVGHVTGIDVDVATIEVARARAAADNVDYLVGDFMTHPFEPASFDAVVSVAALHHVDLAAGLARMGALLRPGGTLAVIGLARSRYPRDIVFDSVGAVATRVHRLTKTYWETSAPKVWPPAATYGETREAAMRLLPGSRFRRHVLWRYSLVWAKGQRP